jgi:hypothetical protein
MNCLTQPLTMTNGYGETRSPVPPNTTLASSSSYYSLSDTNPNIYAHNTNLIEPLASHPLTQVLKNKAKQNGSSFQLYESSNAHNGFYSETNWTKKYVLWYKTKIQRIRIKSDEKRLIFILVFMYVGFFFSRLLCTFYFSFSLCLFLSLLFRFRLLRVSRPTFFSFSCMCVYLVHIKT